MNTCETDRPPPRARVVATPNAAPAVPRLRTVNSSLRPAGAGGLRQQIRFCTGHDGAQIAYATSGRGAPLVKASNWLSHLELDIDNPVWGHLIDELSRHHTLLRYDQRGCGLSDWQVEDISFEAWVSDLERVVDAAGLTRFPLLGISQGASIAVAYAVRHPERVSHLILHGGYARGRLKRKPTPEQREEAEMMNRLIELGWGQENPAFRQFFTTQFIPGGTQAQHQWFNELQRVSTSPSNAARMMRAFNEIDIVPMLDQVKCPTLILHAAGDARVPFDEGRLFASHIGDARYVPLESANHLLLQDEPAWERWLQEVRDFLPQQAQEPPQSLTPLTPRERELVELLAQGRDNSQIAACLDLSEKTVRNYITSIYAKLEVENRGQLIVMAREAGFGLSG
jgi:pimeloyl-ACP methyl ester carboxylesterase/DNA-binding CsgD family transcriptional regulator